MARAPDPYRLAVARLCGAGWRTAPWPADDAARELTEVCGDPAVLAQACADAARFWRLRTAAGDCDPRRSRVAAERLAALAEATAGHPVEASPPERNVTG